MYRLSPQDYCSGYRSTPLKVFILTLEMRYNNLDRKVLNEVLNSALSPTRTLRRSLAKVTVQIQIVKKMWMYQHICSFWKAEHKIGYIEHKIGKQIRVLKAAELQFLWVMSKIWCLVKYLRLGRVRDRSWRRRKSDWLITKRWTIIMCGREEINHKWNYRLGVLWHFTFITRAYKMYVQ